MGAFQNMIFPGGKIFTYKSASLSKTGDLLCDLVYLDPNEAISSQMMPPRQMAEVMYMAPPPAAIPTLSAIPCFNLTHTSDMIQNYVPGEIVNATGKFEALQTRDGHSILFGLSSTNTLQAIVEQSRATSTGWQVVDISTNALGSNFANGTSAVVKNFDVNQSAVDGTISMAIVVSSGGLDHLLLSLYNTNIATTWVQTPTSPRLEWKSVPFDAATDANETIGSIGIVGVMFAESDQNLKQHIIVDIDRSSSDTVKQISRFYVNLAGKKECWNPHDVPVDIQDGSYQSCIGRFQNEYVDGAITAGVSGQSAQLVYVPISNAFGDGPPPVRTLSLPGGVQATAIATARAKDRTTDLYAIGASTLYRFHADAEASDSVATKIVSNRIFQGTTKLSAMTGVTTVWGKNSQNQLYYVSCPNDELNTAGSWSLPLPLLNGVENMSSYVNRLGGGNTIFTTGGETLRRLVQATGTRAKLWRQQPILLEAAPLAKAQAFNSYTTTIQLVNDDKMPAGDEELSITTASRTPVYINGLYYVLNPDLIEVPTDKTGTVTIVEPIGNSMNGTTLTVSYSDTSIIIDPTDKHFQKITALNSKEALGAASIPTNVVAGGTLGPAESVPLVNSSASSDNVNTAANALGNLHKIYGSVKSSSVAPLPTPAATPLPEGASANIFGDIVHGVEAVAGDIYHALKSEVENIVHIVYHAILDTAEAIVGAVEWVLNAIETVIEDVIRFLEFLLEWDDIKRTKEVICNLTQRWLQGQIDKLPTAKSMLNNQVSELEAMINQWVGETD
ncbi:hypothetical protein ACHAPU_010878 [Fusarium lateritium]